MYIIHLLILPLHNPQAHYGLICTTLDIDSHMVSAMGEALEAVSNAKVSYEEMQDITIGVWRNSEIAKKTRRLALHLLPPA